MNSHIPYFIFKQKGDIKTITTLYLTELQKENQQRRKFKELKECILQSFPEQ